MLAICTAVLLAAPAAMAQSTSSRVVPEAHRWTAVAGTGGGPIVYSSGHVRNGTGRGGHGSFSSPSGVVGRGGLVSLRSDIGYMREYRSAERAAQDAANSSNPSDNASGVASTPAATATASNGNGNGAVVVPNTDRSGMVDASGNATDTPAVTYTNGSASTLSPSYYDGQSSMSPSYYNTWRAPSAGWIPWTSATPSQ